MEFGEDFFDGGFFDTFELGPVPVVVFVGVAEAEGGVVVVVQCVQVSAAAVVNVAVASDATSPDRTFDLLKDIKVAMTLQRTHFHDVKLMPPGKMLEMITIDAARLLGLEKEIGSLEAGKQADIILIDLNQPHLTPAFMPAHRIVYEATGADVHTVMVEGKILMENRQVKHVDEGKILKDAEREAELMVKRSGVKPFMGMPRRFWGNSRY